MMIIVMIFSTVWRDLLSWHWKDQSKIIFAATAPIPPDLPIWCGDGTDNENEINDGIYHAQNNTEDIANVRAEGFLVDTNNNPAPGNIPSAIPVKMKDNGLSLDQEWGRNNICN